MVINISKDEVKKIIMNYYTKYYGVNSEVNISGYSDSWSNLDYVVNINVKKEVEYNGIKIKIEEKMDLDELTDIFIDFLGDTYKVNRVYYDFSGYGAHEEIDKDLNGFNIDAIKNVKEKVI